jgi:uncharacterized membrane protein YqjE
MQQPSPILPTTDPMAAAPTIEHIGALARQSRTLVQKEIELAKSEMRVDAKHEAQMAGGLGAAALFALLGFMLLLVAAVLALSLVLPGWAAALIVGGAMLVIAAVAAGVGWGRRVKRPLDRTQSSLKEDARWMKRHVA